MLTNKFNLPEPLVNAVMNDSYSRGDSDASVTQLIDAPQIRKLMTGLVVTEDVSECIWRLLGQAMHTVLERAYPGNAIVEQRLFTTVRGWKVSGQFDVYCDGVLVDYKLTSVYAYGKTKPAWVNQLNMLAALARRNDMPVTKLEIVGLWRDWRPREAQFDESYPQAQVSLIPIPLWSPEEAEAYLEERVRLHQMDDPPPCTDEERWRQPEKFALMKKGAKRAIKLFDSSEAMYRHAESAGMLERKIDDLSWVSPHYPEHRPGRYRRCEDFCGAASICPTWQADKPA